MSECKGYKPNTGMAEQMAQRDLEKATLKEKNNDLLQEIERFLRINEYTHCTQTGTVLNFITDHELILGTLHP